MLKVTVLVSGGGTNLQAILDAIDDGSMTDVEIVSVISNNYGVYALTRAEEHGIPTRVVSRRDYKDAADYDDALLSAVTDSGAELVVLAGFLVVIPPAMIRKYRNRIINIHPSLIPSFCGKGYYGLKVHEEALRRGVKITGATVHFVDEGTDTGPIIAQQAVKVQDSDTPKILQQRVMEQAEWVILPQAINMIAHGEIKIGEDR